MAEARQRQPTGLPLHWRWIAILLEPLRPNLSELSQRGQAIFHLAVRGPTRKRSQKHLLDLVPRIGADLIDETACHVARVLPDIRAVHHLQRLGSDL